MNTYLNLTITYSPVKIKTKLRSFYAELATYKVNDDRNTV